MMSDFHLEPGDVLSYSAGSSQTGPEGYRKLRPRGSLLAAVCERWPQVTAALGVDAPLVINAYPATLGTSSTGIILDTYLSPKVLSRGLQLGAATRKPTILTGQPLFVADALLAHVDANRPLPTTMLIMVGGYRCPRSLEQAMRAWLSPAVDTLMLVHGYGVAEVDAGCMIARERDDRGRLIYYPRADVEVELDRDQLLLSLRDRADERVVERWRTGDCAAPIRDGYALWNHRRLHPRVEAELYAWTIEDWARRTGHVHRAGERVWIQLRQGHEPRNADELDFWTFTRDYGSSWLDKPNWT